MDNVNETVYFVTHSSLLLPLPFPLPPSSLSLLSLSLSSTSYRKDMKIIHFLGTIKPWHHRYLPHDGTVIMHPGSDQSHYGAQEFIKKWWEVYHSTLESLSPSESFTEVSISF